MYSANLKSDWFKRSMYTWTSTSQHIFEMYAMNKGLYDYQETYIVTDIGFLFSSTFYFFGLVIRKTCHLNEAELTKYISFQLGLIFIMLMHNARWSVSTWFLSAQYSFIQAYSIDYFTSAVRRTRFVIRSYLLTSLNPTQFNFQRQLCVHPFNTPTLEIIIIIKLLDARKCRSTFNVFVNPIWIFLVSYKL